jgi:cyclophilin family peptidyl-prolyl cis-trans isomerase
VPSAKRARQRAARDDKLAEMEKAKKRSRALRRVIIAVVIAGAITGIVYLVTEPGSKPASSGTTTTSSSTTTSTTPSTTTTTIPTVATATAPTCPTGNVKRHINFTHAPPTCINLHDTYLATVKTDVGNFVIRMPAAQNPAAVNNFVFLAGWKFYDGIIFHRVIPGFMNQGGDPTGTGTGGPGYQWTGNSPRGCGQHCYRLGVVAMANSGTPTSNGSQFFIMNTAHATLAPDYTRFGRVTSGISVIERIAAGGTQSGTPTVVHHMISVTITSIPSS